MLTLQTLQCNDPKLAQVGPGFSGFSSSSSSWTPPNSTMPARMAWQAAGSGTGSSAAPHSLRRPRLPASPLVQSIKRPATWARPRDHGTTGPRAPRVGALVGNLRWNSFSDSKIQIHKKWWFSLTFTKRTSDPLLPWGCKPQCASPSKSEHIAQCISNILQLRTIRPHQICDWRCNRGLKEFSYQGRSQGLQLLSSHGICQALMDLLDRINRINRIDVDLGFRTARWHVFWGRTVLRASRSCNLSAMSFQVAQSLAFRNDLKRCKTKHDKTIQNSAISKLISGQGTSLKFTKLTKIISCPAVLFRNGS